MKVSGEREIELLPFYSAFGLIIFFWFGSLLAINVYILVKLSNGWLKNRDIANFAKIVSLLQIIWIILYCITIYISRHAVALVLFNVIGFLTMLLSVIQHLKLAELTGSEGTFFSRRNCGLMKSSVIVFHLVTTSPSCIIFMLDDAGRQFILFYRDIGRFLWAALSMIVNKILAFYTLIRLVNFGSYDDDYDGYASLLHVAMVTACCDVLAITTFLALNFQTSLEYQAKINIERMVISFASISMNFFPLMLKLIEHFITQNRDPKETQPNSKIAKSSATVTKTVEELE
jgi:hypothetical protein